MQKKINSILVISPGYPIEGEPEYVFVQNLCNEFALKGYDVTVLSTQSLTSAIKHRKRKRPRKRYENVIGNRVTIYQPYTITFSYRFWKLYNRMTRRGSMRFLSKVDIKPDVCYCHFWRSAYQVLPYVKKNHIPLFVATGEGSLSSIAKTLESPEYLKINKYLNGVISVSTNNKIISQEIGLLNGKDCLVAPNAVDSSLCYKKDKVTLRKQYGFEENVFIVAFVGAFNDRKGSQRVSSAIDIVGDVKSFFIGGQGESALLDPTCEGILFKGRLPHEKIPDYLNMADIFVLPTLNEGCCNAIVEALACGLPVVSSNRPFNYDVLNETNSIMVDPTNVAEIAAAIKDLKDNYELRNRLSEGALRMAEDLTIDRRAEKILSFMEQHI